MDGTGGIQEEKINVDIITLTRFLTEEQSKHPVSFLPLLEYFQSLTPSGASINTS